MKKERTTQKVADLTTNDGQLGWLPANPRTWTQADIDRTSRSIAKDTDFLEDRPILAIPHEGKFVVFAGNLRYTASKGLALKSVPVVVYTPETEEDRETIKRRSILDNGQFGSWDYDALANEWDDLPLAEFGVPTWNTEEPEDEGYTLDDSKAGKLVDKFIVPPFSVLDTKKEYWTKRKAWWLEKTGNLSETRDGEYGTIGNGNGASLLNTINGGTSNFDPVLAELIMKWFCKQGGAVIDPFGGEQTKGVVAGELGMEYHAVEIRPEQVEVDKEATQDYPKVHYYCGDSTKISGIVQKRDFDLCFTSPPYYDLEIYSKNDLSALGTYEEFMAAYKTIFKQCYEMMKEGSFLVVKVGEIRDKKTGVYRNFVGDNITTMTDIGFKYYNEIILYQSIGTAAIRANQNMKARKVVKVHQNVLVFYKGNPAMISKELPAFDYRGEDFADYFDNDAE